MAKSPLALPEEQNVLLMEHPIQETTLIMFGNQHPRARLPLLKQSLILRVYDEKHRVL